MSEAEKEAQGQKPKTSKIALWSFILASISCATLITASILLAISPLPKSFEWLYRLRPYLSLIFLITYSASLVLGICGILEIRKGQLKGIRLAIGAMLINIIIAAGIVGVALLIVRPMLHRITCEMNMPGLGVALKIYANDFNGKYPAPEKWCDLLIEYAEVTEKSFVCPAAKEGRGHYAINPNCEPNSPPDVVLLFETQGGWNQSGGPDLLAGERHIGKGCCILFNNKHIQFVEKKRFGQLKWKAE
ncbi:MAG: hypothetical protein ACYSWZ_18985 [Planctomycetota bacterium]|jgi:hypothetical protein